MKLYTVLERTTPTGDDPDLVLVKEGFNWPAFLVPLLWLIVRGQWLGLIAYFAASGLIGAIGSLLGLVPAAQLALAVMLALLVGAEANDWRRWRLAARGYELRGVVAGRNMAEAEERWIRGRFENGAVRSGTPARPRQAPAAWQGAGLAAFPNPVDRA
jgi:hypothetical protein